MLRKNEQKKVNFSQLEEIKAETKKEGTNSVEKNVENEEDSSEDKQYALEERTNTAGKPVGSYYKKKKPKKPTQPKFDHLKKRQFMTRREVTDAYRAS